MKMALHLSTNFFAFVLLRLAIAASAAYVSGSKISPNNMTYTLISNHQLDWFDAYRFCEARGLQLAHGIEDNAEFDFIHRMLIGARVKSRVWLGGTEIGNEDRYYWVKSGATVELNRWDPGQENKIGKRCLTCANGHWYPEYCEAPLFFICMEPKS